MVSTRVRRQRAASTKYVSAHKAPSPHLHLHHTVTETEHTVLPIARLSRGAVAHDAARIVGTLVVHVATSVPSST